MAEILPQQIAKGWRPGRGSQPHRFAFARRLPTLGTIQRTKRLWWANGWWGDQQTTSQCTIYSWLHYLHDGPVTHRGAPRPMADPTTLYQEGQRIDGTALWDVDSGLTTNASAQVMLRRGMIQRYEWADTVDEIVQALLHVGPVPFGTWWRLGMQEPALDGRIAYAGRYLGGHQVLFNGVDTRSEEIRIKNSWGRPWGRRGHCTMSFADVEQALREGAEAVVAVETP